MARQHGDDVVFASGKLRRLPRRGGPLDALDLYAHVVETTGASIADPHRIDVALTRVRQDLLELTRRESTLHGWRVQALFEAIVASLGAVRLLKLEDVGDLFYCGDELKPPDFRIVTAQGNQIFVEVKSFYQKNASSDYRIRRSDLDQLDHYVDMVGGGSLKYAIYWSRWNRWTLVDPSRFSSDSGVHLQLSVVEAIAANEMGSLGDRIIATEWPLALTLYSDAAKSRVVTAEGRVQFTAGRAEFTVAGRPVTDTTEQRIVHRLMYYGGWAEETSVDVVDGELLSMSVMCSPDEPPPSPQPFAMHAPLSSIYSSMFNAATIDEDGVITELRIDIDPGALSSLIPDGYKGKVLRIWRFHLVPS